MAIIQRVSGGLGQPRWSVATVPRNEPARPRWRCSERHAPSSTAAWGRERSSLAVDRIEAQCESPRIKSRREVPATARSGGAGSVETCSRRDVRDRLGQAGAKPVHLIDGRCPDRKAKQPSGSVGGWSPSMPATSAPSSDHLRRA